jgi:hypothetical protein
MPSIRKLLTMAAAWILCAEVAAQPATQPAFVNTIDTVPPDWKGPVFELSKDYPLAAPPMDPKPWKKFDFKTQPEEYIRSVLSYCREGNEAVDWVGQKNAVRKWYHAPGLVKGNNGREFIHGLTAERSSRQNELAPTQTKAWTNWAVGLYNPTAARTIGMVWKDPADPNSDGIKFDDGSVGVKLLFTTAPPEQVPFLANSKEWQANVSLPGNNDRSPQAVRLLQVDVAVRDDRANATTGWVFGTFMYQNDAAGASPFDRLVPVGLMWGNDPELTPGKAAMGEKPKESWINPSSKSPHFGWLGRLNGPVDNPISSCLSCHARAGNPQTNALVFPANATDDEKMAFFANVKAGEPYAPGLRSFDYSLQLGIGVRNFPGAPSAPNGKAFAKPVASVPPGFNPRAGEVDPSHPADVSGPDPERLGPKVQPDAPPPPTPPEQDQSTGWIIAGGFLVAILLIILVFFAMKGKRAPPANP